LAPERGDLLQRNVEYHLEVSDQLGRAGSDAALESGQLVVTIECSGSGYFKIGPALDALEAEAEGLGAAFYWALTHALYRVMRIYNHDDALMYEERMREYADQDEEENRGQYEFPEVEKALPECIRKTLKRECPDWRTRDRELLRRFSQRQIRHLDRAVAAHSAALPASTQAVAGLPRSSVTTTILHCRLCLSPSKSMTPSPPASTKRANT
jgi:hypothetical protein